jgi:1,4-alpha-glucan branching enzyme
MKKKPVANSSKVAITFEMPSDVASESLNVVGDFNDWEASATPMKRLKDGSWSTTLRMAPGTYRYRYLADSSVWHNDGSADRYEPSGLGSDNSVLVINST